MSKSSLRFVDDWADIDDARKRIREIAEFLTLANLTDRFGVEPAPRRIVTTRKGPNPRRKDTVLAYSFGVYLTDRYPDLPPPEGITLSSKPEPITLEEELATPHSIEEEQAAVEYIARGRPARVYEALGQRKSIADWAKAVGVSTDTLRYHLGLGETMEEALVRLATKKSRKAG